VKEGAAEEMDELRLLPSSRYVQRYVLAAVAEVKEGAAEEMDELHVFYQVQGTYRGTSWWLLLG